MKNLTFIFLTVLVVHCSTKPLAENNSGELSHIYGSLLDNGINGQGTKTDKEPTETKTRRRIRGGRDPGVSKGSEPEVNPGILSGLKLLAVIESITICETSKVPETTEECQESTEAGKEVTRETKCNPESEKTEKLGKQQQKILKLQKLKKQQQKLMNRQRKLLRKEMKKRQLQ